MVHDTRPFNIGSIATLPEAARELIRVRSWVLCQGFEVSVAPDVSWLLLNDSLSEDGAQEYAICLRTAEGIKQVDSYTVSWATEQELTEFLLKAEADRQAGTLAFLYGQVAPLRPHPSPSCSRCA